MQQLGVILLDYDRACPYWESLTCRWLSGIVVEHE